MSDLIQLGSIKERPKQPAPEDVELKFSKQAIQELEALKSHYPNEKACILPALWIAQREYGGNLPGEAIAEVAIRLKRSYSEIEGVATFYSMYNTHPAGKHKIEVCTCLTCQVCGGYKIFNYLKEKLGIGHGETTKDGLFTLEEVECLNACDRAPLIQVGDEYHGPVSSKDIDQLLDKLRNQKESVNIKMANEIVQVHLKQSEKENIKQ